VPPFISITIVLWKRVHSHLYAPWPSAFLAPSVLISATDWHISITYCPDTMLCACIVGKAGSLVAFWSHEFSEICTEWTLLFNKTQVNELVLRWTIGGRHTSTYLLNIILCWRINLIKVGLYFHCTYAWRFYLWHIVTFISFRFCFYSLTFICGMAIFFFNFLNSIKMATFRGAATSPANQDGALPSWCRKEGWTTHVRDLACVCLWFYTLKAHLGEKGCGCCFFMSLIHIHKQMLLTTVGW